jgi:Transglutaminase-like superfamily
MSQSKQAIIKKYVVLLLVLAVLIALSGAYVMTGSQVYSRYQQAILANQQHCGGQAPVHICVHTPDNIYSAFYPFYQSAEYPLLGVDYTSTAPINLLISMSIPNFSQAQTRTVKANTTDQTGYFIPPLQGKALQGLTHDERTSVHVEVTDTKHHLYYIDNTPLLLHSRMLMQWLGANRLQIAAWITPNDQAIASLVNTASSHLAAQSLSSPTSMIGYTDASQSQVIDQVNAIYDTLWQDYHLHYIQDNVPYRGFDDTNTSIESIRLPSEVLQQHSTTSIELTTLAASAAERIGLNAEIIIIPGHAFLGVATDPDNDHFEYWDVLNTNGDVTGHSANVQADKEYTTNFKKNTILDTIRVQDARNANVGAML